MGDGGVACAPSQHVMDKFSICGEGNTMLNSSPKSTIKLAKVKVKMKPKNNKESELGLKHSVILNDDGGERNANGRIREGTEEEDDEVEEGELGTLPFENGEFVPGKPSIKSEIERTEFMPGKWRRCGGEFDKSDWKTSKDELETGEFVPNRWCRRDNANKSNDCSYVKTQRYDKRRRLDREWTSSSGKERGWKVYRDSERTPPARRERDWKAERDWSPPSSGKYSSEKDLGRNIGSNQQHSRKFYSRYGAEKTPKLSSKITGEEALVKNDSSSSMSHTRDYSTSNRSKRLGNDSDSGGRKYYTDYDDHSNSKNRKTFDVGCPSSDHCSAVAVDRPCKPAAFASSRSSERYASSSRYLESCRTVPDRHNSSPHHCEWSPLDRAHNEDYREHSPALWGTPSYDEGPLNARSRSPYARNHYDNRYRSSPRNHGRSTDGRARTPTFSERSPGVLRRYNNHKETNRKVGVCEKRTSHQGDSGKEGKHNLVKDSGGRDSQFSAKQSPDRGNLDNQNVSMDKIASQVRHCKDLSQSPALKIVESSQENGVSEEPASMEEDMDICTTPPHVPEVVDAVAGKWYYLDHLGVEHGPSKLSDLKKLLKEGYIVSDHLVKHLDSDRWVTVEKAVSPLVTMNYHTVVPDTVTQLVCPPEAPGNLLADNRNDVSGNEELLAPSHPVVCSEDNSTASKSTVDFHIEERVGALLEGATLIPGKEVEVLAEALQMTFEPGEWERWGRMEGCTRCQWDTDEHFKYGGVKGWLFDSDHKHSDPPEPAATVSVSFEQDNVLASTNVVESYSNQWACKGGDWKRDEESTQDRTWKRKLVLTDGYPLCLMPKSGCEDPRWQQKVELYHPSQSRRLDLPLWAFVPPDEVNEPSGLNISTQTKSAIVRGVRGTMLPVIRINSCVVRDQGSFVLESHVKVRGKERHSSRSLRTHSTTGDSKRLLADAHWKSSQEQDTPDLRKSSKSFSIAKDHLCKFDELKLHLGDWYFLDGAGHEHGPLSFSKLQAMAGQGVIQKHSSVYRKRDNIWVPVTLPTEPVVIPGHENNSSCSTPVPEARGAVLSESQKISHGFHAVLSESQKISHGFHGLHPQFIGYTLGKLHELVMKSYKSREFAAAINEVLDPWITLRQSKKEIEKHIFHSDHFLTNKRARLYGIDEGYEMQGVHAIQNNECRFEDLCGDATFREVDVDSRGEEGRWDLLDSHILARVFHFLRADLKSLVCSALTCKRWRCVVKFYKDITRLVDFRELASSCSDSVLLKIMHDYKKEKITSLVLRGCTGITAGVLEEVILSFPSLASVDIRGCTQFEDLVCKFPHINWVRSQGPHLKFWSLHNSGDRSSSTCDQMDDSNGLTEYLESSEKGDSGNQLFCRSLYKRSKLFDARKSSSILSRDAQLRRVAIKKTGNEYKRMEEYIAAALEEIMSESTFEFFEPKVAEIVKRMRNGYYANCGLTNIKEDISRMCREALKIKNRGDGRSMNRIVTMFIQLATSLDKGLVLAHARDKMMKSWRDDSPPGFSSIPSRNKKSIIKVSERKHSYRSNDTFMSGFLYSEDYASDHEIRRRLSKLNKKSFGSRNNATDDSDKSSDASVGDSTSTSSDIESELESPFEGAMSESRREACISPDGRFDSFSDEREWGARMTKASLVPPVTRKYEVIDCYVIVADDEEVRRKMQVSLPEDYTEKLNAQRNGTEEADMEIPEVKDYKPRKSLGDEVIEQEVYGIDPYTHNLLIDSMPNASDLSLLDKHLFIEEVLLRTLNKQVRKFTGSGNTPMTYPLKGVFEKILETAEENDDRKTMRICQFILEAIDTRPEDKYVAYRKGLGVVCNKEGGFTEDDFVVEFLGEVYPTWKWYEKQDGIRALQKNNNDPAPEFYNINLERPKGDADGYDLVIVDAMHKANYASRICHSCRPNCEAKVTAVDGYYQIGIYSVRPIAYGEEVTFDYNSVTESKEEYEASVCLCGSQVCRGSYLNLTGEGAFQKVLKEHHGLLDRCILLLEACELNSVCEEDYIDLGKAGLGSCLLGGLPDWLISYTACLVRFINFERMKLPDEILRYNIEEKKRYFTEINLEVEKSDAEIQAEGVYNQRLQNLALTIDKVKYVMRRVFGDPKKAPPPLERLSPEAVASHLWKGDGSFIEELIQSVAPHVEDDVLKDLKAKIHSHDPSGSDYPQTRLRKSLLWLRDEVRNLSCTYKSRHDAAADLINMYAYTKCYFRIREYKKVISPPVYITPLDLGPKYADKLGSGIHEYRKTYGETYCLGQLLFWYSQHAEPDATLAKAGRGCLSLPDVSSFYAKVQKPSCQRIYGPKTVKFMLSRMEKQPQRPWPNDRIWSFKTSLKVFGSPMLDAVLHKAPLDKEMVHWLKHRPPVYHAVG